MTTKAKFWGCFLLLALGAAYVYFNISYSSKPVISIIKYNGYFEVTMSYQWAKVTKQFSSFDRVWKEKKLGYTFLAQPQRGGLRLAILDKKGQILKQQDLF